MKKVDKKAAAKKKAALKKEAAEKKALAKTQAKLKALNKKPAPKSKACSTCCKAKFAQIDGGEECMEEDMMLAQLNSWDDDVNSFAQANVEAEAELDEIEQMLGDLSVDELAQIADILENEDMNSLA